MPRFRPSGCNFKNSHNSGISNEVLYVAELQVAPEKLNLLIDIYFLLLKTAMELMGIVGVMVNCALIGQSGQVHRMFPNITGTQTILLIIILEVRQYWKKVK